MILDVVCESFVSEICVSKRCYIVKEKSRLWYVASIRVKEDRDCPVDSGTLPGTGSRFLTILCELRHDSGTGCESHARVGDFGDRYTHNFLWPNVTISRLFC